MKPRTILMTSLALLFAITTVLGTVPNGDDSSKNSIRLLISPDLLEMANTWVSEYTTTHPGVIITIDPIREEGLNDLLLQESYMGLVTKKSLSDISNYNPWMMAVGREVIVPVMNANNPYREEILEMGIAPELFSRVFCDGGEKTWGSILHKDRTGSVVPYVAAGTSAKAYLADFLNTDSDQIKGKEIAGMDEMVECIRNDRNAIGFCGLEEVMNMETGEVVAGLSLIPIDLNGNGSIDLLEDIYKDVSTLSRGIWLGKYPKTLSSRLYMVAHNSPSGTGRLDFLEWMLADGQQLLAANGFSALSNSEKYTRREQLANINMDAVTVPVTASSLKSFLKVLGGILAFLAIVLIVAKILRRSSEKAGAEGFQSRPVMRENLVSFPGGLFFDKSHTWTFMEKDGNVRIGIDDFLQKVTGPITRVIMKEPGEHIKKGESFLSLVQQGKQLEIQSPVSGVVVGQNRALVEDSSSINNAPYSEGWVYMVEPLNWLKEMKAYAMGDHYREWIKAEFSRLKDFLSSGIKPLGNVKPAQVMQEGGEIREGVLEGFGPDVWEEFQTGFINIPG